MEICAYLYVAWRVCKSWHVPKLPLAQCDFARFRIPADAPTQIDGCSILVLRAIDAPATKRGGKRTKEKFKNGWREIEMGLLVLLLGFFYTRVYVYTRMSARACMHVQRHAHAHTHVGVHTYTRSLMHTHTETHLYKCAYMCVCVCVCMCKCVCMCMCMCVCVCARVCECTCIHT